MLAAAVVAMPYSVSRTLGEIEASSISPWAAHIGSHLMQQAKVLSTSTHIASNNKRSEFQSQPTIAQQQRHDTCIPTLLRQKFVLMMPSDFTKVVPWNRYCSLTLAAPSRAANCCFLRSYAALKVGSIT